MYHNIPLELQQLNQWVCWRYEERVDGRGNKYQSKVPYSPSMHAAGKAASGFTRFRGQASRVGGAKARAGGAPFDPDLAGELL